MTDPSLTPTLDWWVIADTHWGHDNIVKYCQRPPHHDALMTRNWRALVKPTDTVLHLGDVVWRQPPDLLEMIAGLPGKKYLVRGNHDRRRTRAFFTRLGFTIVDPFLFQVRQLRIWVSHEPQMHQQGLVWDFNLHGHIHNNHDASLTRPHYLNCSVEVRDYAPQRLGTILDRHQTLHGKSLRELA